MAWIFADSFDFYADTSDMYKGHWDYGEQFRQSNDPAGISSVAARFSGKGLVGSYWAGSAFKRSPTRDVGHHLVFAIKIPAASFGANHFYLALMDSSNDGVQCTVALDMSGQLTLTAGRAEGQVLAAMPSRLSAGVWYGVEVELVVHPTAGSFRVRLNGSNADDFVASGLNTAQGSGQAGADKLQLGIYYGNGTGMYFDDLLWFSTSGAAPNTWVGDVRSVQRMPVANSDVQLTPSQSHQDFSTGGTDYQMGQGGDTLRTGFVTSVAIPSVIGTLGVSVAQAYTGRFRLGLYDADGAGGGPGTLLGRTVEQTNAPVGPAALAMEQPVSVGAGRNFWIALHTDSSMATLGTVKLFVGHGDGGRSYADGLPTPFSAPYVDTPGGIMFTTFSTITSNFSLVNQAAEDGDATYVYGAAPGTGDFYALASLGSVPGLVLGVQTRMMARKSDSEERAASVRLRSSGALVASPPKPLNSDYSYTARVDVVDPATGAAWTAAALNAVEIGPFLAD